MADASVIGICGSTIDRMPNFTSVVDALAQLYPHSTVVRWEYPEQGMDHAVDVAHLSSGERLVVRRPLTQAYKDHAGLEGQILKELRATQVGVLPARLPETIVTTAEFHIQSFVPGVSLDAALWKRLDGQDRTRIIDQLGHFLDSLRSVGDEFKTQETAWIVEGDLNGREARALPHKVELSHQRAQANLYPLLSRAQASGVDAIFATMWECLGALSPRDLSLVHSDLYSTHLRIAHDHGTASLGIIDFSDMNIGDPAIDLQHLADISPEILHAVCADEQVKARARAYKQWDNIFLVVDHLRRDDVAGARALLAETLGRA